jgi:phosphoserine phosphatase
VAIRDATFTAEVVPPLTYAAGKVAAVRACGKLAVACGDSLPGDLALLEAAAVAVVVAPAAGSPLSAEAARRGWFVLDQR